MLSSLDLFGFPVYPTRSRLSLLGTSPPETGESSPHPQPLLLLQEEEASGIKEVLKVFLPPPDNILSWGQQHYTCTIHSVAMTVYKG